MMGQFLYLTLVTAMALGEASAGPEPRPQPSPKSAPQPTRIELGDLKTEGEGEVKKDRAALLRSSKILPFLTEPFVESISLPGSVGVSLGLGLPVPSPVLPLQPPSGRPVLIPTRRPECAIDEDYCLYNQYYPLDKVNSIIDRYYNDVSHMYRDLYHYPANDVIHHENRTHTYRQRGHFVCESSVHYVRPGWAQNIYGEWLAVINTDKFPQSVRMESCRYKDKRCEYLPPCYKSRCVQRYSYIKLLGLDPYRPSYRPTVDVFKIPSACSCFVEDFTYY